MIGTSNDRKYKANFISHIQLFGDEYFRKLLEYLLLTLKFT